MVPGFTGRRHGIYPLASATLFWNLGNNLMDWMLSLAYVKTLAVKQIAHHIEFLYWIEGSRNVLADARGCCVHLFDVLGMIHPWTFCPDKRKKTAPGGEPPKVWNGLFNNKSEETPSVCKQIILSTSSQLVRSWITISTKAETANALAVAVVSKRIAAFCRDLRSAKHIRRSC